MKLDHCNRAACVQIIEALTKELDEAASNCVMYRQQLAAAQAQVALLREALAEASNEISDWGHYASEYFQDKYKLEEVVARYAKIAAGEMK